ncbi:MAG TPA: hypothetical protein VIO64_21730 [Pseudobacteroides sp.]|uniref:HzsA-related protein n=1 Tax=Pseudobacteroides sp. TaxID=1968840 RepID=UPI002F9302EA
MARVSKLLYRVAVIIIVTGIILSTQTFTTLSASIDFTKSEFAFDKIVFTKHQPYSFPGIENHMIDGSFGFNAVKGGGLYILNNAFSGNPTVTDVLANSVCANGRYAGRKLTGGAFYSFDLSYDAKQIVFAYTDAQNSYGVWNQSTTYHIFKVNVDGTNLTQLTDGAYNDFDPRWLPDGRIIFISERRGGYGRCHQRIVPTFNLHTMNADGSDIRCISYHETNEWSPSVDNNGMIIYTRWDYMDRGANHAHSAWITTPDGLDARAVTLNYPNSGPSWWTNVPLAQMHLRAIPNSNKYVGTAVPHHAQNYGALIVIDPDVEDDDNLSTITKITPDAKYPESETGITTDQKYATPYPLSEDYYLCVYDPNANTNGGNKRYGIYAIDTKGNKSLLYSDPNFSCYGPMPLRPRKVPNIIPGTAKPTGQAQDGVVSVMNVYNSLLPLPSGTKIKELRIWQVYPKTTTMATDPMVSYESTESIWAGRNTRGLLGSVPVESDGSASFYMPAGRAVFFQAVDQDGTAVQTMRSDTFLIPGQTKLYCQGCHEPGRQAAVNPESVPLALRREPSKITPDPSQGSRPVSFPRLIQPILDKKCISCHNGSQVPDLRKGTTDAQTKWFSSYKNLKPYVALFDGIYPGADWNKVYPRTEPGKFGARASKLYQKLKTGHGSLTQSELHSFIVWLDSGIAPFFGEYKNIDAQLRGEQVEPSLN